MSEIRLAITESQIDKWFRSMHEYKEEIHRRYLESLETDLKMQINEGNGHS